MKPNTDNTETTAEKSRQVSGRVQRLVSPYFSDGVESHLFRIGGVCPRDVCNSDRYLGIVGYDYCPVTEVVRAAESKGVRLMKSDLINNESESINQGVMIFRGATAHLVDAIYDSGVSGSAIEKILQSLRSLRLANGRILDSGHITDGARDSGEIGGHDIIIG